MSNTKNETSSFAKGDVVRLKSGGPQMTVEALDDIFGVNCVWFERTSVHRAAFDVALLIKADSLIGGMYVARG